MEDRLQPTVSIIRCSELVRILPQDLVGEFRFDQNFIEIVCVIPEIYRSSITEKNGVRFVFDQGKGIYEAMQLGVENASGKFVIFINDDDSLVSDFEDILHNNGIGVTSSADLYEFEVLSLNRGKLTKLSFKPESKLNFGQMSTSHQGQLWSTDTIRQLGFFRRELVISKVFQLRIKLRIAADLDLYLRAKEIGIKKVQISKVIAVVKSGGYSDLHSHQRYSEVAAILASRKNYTIIVWVFIFLRFQISGLISRLGICV